MSPNRFSSLPLYCTRCGSKEHTDDECPGMFLTFAKWIFIVVLSIVIGIVLGGLYE